MPRWHRLIVLVLVSLAMAGCSQTPTVQSAPPSGGAVKGGSGIPAPFLTMPFARGTQIEVTEGWIYGEEEQKIHGVKEHHALDLAVPRGTPVYAAADGMAIASYQFRHPGEYQGKVYGYAMGHFVEIRHDNGLHTQYGHLERIADIPTIEAIKKSDSWWDPVAIYKPSGEIIPESIRVNAGQLLGYVGTTGLSLGVVETPTSSKDVPTWDEPHLHFEVFQRGPDGTKSKRYDPFGLESPKLEDYQKAIKGPATGLWMGGKGGTGIGWRR